MNFLRQSDQRGKNLWITHLPNDNFEFSDAITINFTKIIKDFDEVISLKGRYCCCIFCLDDWIIANQVIAWKSAIEKMNTIWYSHTKLKKVYVIYFSFP